MSDTFISALASAGGALIILVLRELVIGEIRQARNKEMVDYNHKKHVLLENVKIKNSTRSAIGIEEFKSEINKELEREKGVIQVKVQKELEPFKKQLKKGNAIAIATYQELLKKRYKKIESYYLKMTDLNVSIGFPQTLPPYSYAFLEERLNILINEYNKCRLFMDDDLCEKIKTYINKTKMLVICSLREHRLREEEEGIDVVESRAANSEKTDTIREELHDLIGIIERLIKVDFIGLGMFEKF
jgi:hypothetical protein